MKLRSPDGPLAPNRFISAYVAVYILFLAVALLDLPPVSTLATACHISAILAFVVAFFLIPLVFHSPLSLIGATAAVAPMVLLVLRDPDGVLDGLTAIVAYAGIGSSIVAAVRRDWRGFAYLFAFVLILLFPSVHQFSCQ